jgi:predicted esterase
MGLAEEFTQPDWVYLAPNAANLTWYPDRFIAPIAANEPWLSSALAVIDGLVAHLTDHGFSSEQLVLAGFSQGACLALEYAARNPRRYGGLLGYSGGLIGPPELALDYPGSLSGTPVFLGCDEADFHIPRERVLETARVLEGMEAQVTIRLYKGMGHTINGDEIAFGRSIIGSVISTSGDGLA